jgi:hypothetical protein
VENVKYAKWGKNNNFSQFPFPTPPSISIPLAFSLFIFCFYFPSIKWEKNKNIYSFSVGSNINSISYNNINKLINNTFRSGHVVMDGHKSFPYEKVVKNSWSKHFGLCLKIKMSICFGLDIYYIYYRFTYFYTIFPEADNFKIYYKKFTSFSTTKNKQAKFYFINHWVKQLNIVKKILSQYVKYGKKCSKNIAKWGKNKFGNWILVKLTKKIVKVVKNG